MRGCGHRSPGPASQANRVERLCVSVPLWPDSIRHGTRVTHVVDHPAFRHLDHRPWPVPDRRWAWRQTWRDLLFAHWPVASDKLRHLVPPALTIQEFDGTAWVGLVPFRMTGVMRRPFPDLPWISAFPEVNVRLYVEHQGKPGVWFLSLDAENPLAVWAARRFFRLPYFRAAFRLRQRGEQLDYTAARTTGPPASLHVRYQPASAVYRSVPGTLEHALTERYCLYAEAPDGSLLRNDVHHQPWSLQKAEAEFLDNTYLSSHGLRASGAPILHFARGIDVVVWPAQRLEAGS